MYQHPIALDINASYHRQEALRAADVRRRLNDGYEARGATVGFGVRRRVSALAVIFAAVLVVALVL